MSATFARGQTAMELGAWNKYPAIVFRRLPTREHPSSHPTSACSYDFLRSDFLTFVDLEIPPFQTSLLPVVEGKSRTRGGQAAALRINLNVQDCGIVAAPVHAPSRAPLRLPLLISMMMMPFICSCRNNKYHNLPLPRFHLCVMVRLVHTGLGSSSLIAHVLNYPPPPTRTAL